MSGSTEGWTDWYESKTPSVCREAPWATIGPCWMGCHLAPNRALRWKENMDANVQPSERHGGEPDAGKGAGLIARSPDVLGGTPVFAGTRVPVRVLLDYLEAGDRLDDFLDDFPSVHREQAVRALELAAPALLAQA